MCKVRSENDHAASACSTSVVSNADSKWINVGFGAVQVKVR